MKNDDDVVIDGTGGSDAVAGEKLEISEKTVPFDSSFKSIEISATEGEEKKDKKEVEPSSVPPSFTKFISLAAPEAMMLVIAVLFMIFAEAGQLYIPLVIANAYDTLIDPSYDEIGDDSGSNSRMDDISYYMILAIIIHVIASVSGFLRATIMSAAGERLVARLRNGLFQSILIQEIAFFDEHKSGELVSRLGSDTTLLQTSIASSFPESVLGIGKAIVGITLMFWISTKLAGITLGSLVIIMCMSAPIGKEIGRLSKVYQDVLGTAQTISTEALGSMRTVQAFAAEQREHQRYQTMIGNPDDYKWWWPTYKDKNNGNNASTTTTATDGTTEYPEGTTTYSAGFFKSIATSGFFVFIFGAGFGVLYLSLWYGFSLVVQNEITLGQLTAFQSYIYQIGFGLGHTSAHISKVLEALGASGRIFYLLERIPKIPQQQSSDTCSSTTDENSDANDTNNDTSATSTNNIQVLPESKHPTTMTGLVEIENLCFSYPSREHVKVLHNVSLRIEPNTTTAFVGSSGAGKSTIISLMQRFYDIDSGSIKIDGNDIRSLDLYWLRNHIGYVQQEPQLFGMTVKENLLFGIIDQSTITQEQIEEVCKQANAHDFIISWPLGYDTLVGERGIKLSGGQKQRIAIARALLVNPRILLLDEATSALDAESEHLVQKAIDNVVIGRTVLIVAHRLSTIQNATQIVVVDNHQIVDVDNHHNLIKRCSKYQDLIKRQSMIIDNTTITDNGGGGSSSLFSICSDDDDDDDDDEIRKEK